jgi:hypothetical protein
LIFWIGGQVIHAPAGAFVFGPRDIPHIFRRLNKFVEVVETRWSLKPICRRWSRTEKRLAFAGWAQRSAGRKRNVHAGSEQMTLF